MKCFSRHQSAVTLSSCEAELVALQSGVQEGIGLLRTLGFVLGRLYPWVDIIPQDAQVTWYDEAESDDEDSMKVSYLFPLVVKTDSLSGKMLLEASDLQRKSRHIGQVGKCNVPTGLSLEKPWWGGGTISFTVFICLSHLYSCFTRYTFTV